VLASTAPNPADDVKPEQNGRFLPCNPIGLLNCSERAFSRLKKVAVINFWRDGEEFCWRHVRRNVSYQRSLRVLEACPRLLG